MSQPRMSFDNLLTAWGFSVASVLGQMFANLAYLTCEFPPVDHACHFLLEWPQISTHLYVHAKAKDKSEFKWKSYRS